jgi:hypothetical protein
MRLIIDRRGDVRCVYSEVIDLAELGSVKISRGSHVEPDCYGFWIADLAPVKGPRLGPFLTRSDALEAETEWLDIHWLSDSPPT